MGAAAVAEQAPEEVEEKRALQAAPGQGPPSGDPAGHAPGEAGRVEYSTASPWRTFAAPPPTYSEARSYALASPARSASPLATRSPSPPVRSMSPPVRSMSPAPHSYAHVGPVARGRNDSPPRRYALQQGVASPAGSPARHQQQYQQHPAGQRPQSGLASPTAPPLQMQQYVQPAGWTSPKVSYTPPPQQLSYTPPPQQLSYTPPPQQFQQPPRSGASTPLATGMRQPPRSGASTPLATGMRPPSGANAGTLTTYEPQLQQQYPTSASPLRLPLQSQGQVEFSLPALSLNLQSSHADARGADSAQAAAALMGQRSPEASACGPEARDRVNRRDLDYENTVCGVDKRPLLPAVLVSTLLLGGACLLTVHRELVADAAGADADLAFVAAFCVLYFATFSTMVFAALVDPGQLDDESFQLWLDGARPLPSRAHKTWHCERPVLRFDHFCRWIKNCIGLRNHREFLVMTAGCVAIATLGTLVDALLLGRALYLSRDALPQALLENWRMRACILAHFIYSAILMYFSAPILQLHVGFVSRNELAKDWRLDRFYVVEHPQTKKLTSVQDLDAKAYNDLFDEFQYDSTRNPWDKGWGANCWAFWCTPRWAPDQLGEF